MCPEHCLASLASPDTQKGVRASADSEQRPSKIEALRVRHDELMARSGKLASRNQRRRGHAPDNNFQAEYDAISDEMIDLSVQLSSVPAVTLEALKLKASLLLDILPDEADPTVYLALSLCEDLLDITGEQLNGHKRAAGPVDRHRPAA